MRKPRAHSLFTPRRRRPIGCLTVFLLFIAAVLMTLTLNGLSNRYVRLETRPVTILKLPRALEGFKILHISDLHAANLGPTQENLKSALGSEGYDAVALTGDMVGKSGNVTPLLDLLALVAQDIPVFLVAGDDDPAPLEMAPHSSSDVKAAYVRMAEAAGAIYLDAPYPHEADGETIWFCPGNMFFYDLPNARSSLKERIDALKALDNPYLPEAGAELRYQEYQLDKVEETMAALEEMTEEDIIIALSHVPPGTEALGELSILSREQGLIKPSLFLAGQFNKGQARVPGLGPLYIPRQADGSGGFLPGDEGFAGLSIVKGFPMHISPGLGVSGYYPIPLRLFNMPGITILELTSKMTR